MPLVHKTILINGLSQVLGSMRRYDSLHKCIPIYVPLMYNEIYCVSFTMAVRRLEAVIAHLIREANTRITIDGDAL